MQLTMILSLILLSFFLSISLLRFLSFLSLSAALSFSPQDPKKQTHLSFSLFLFLSLPLPPTHLVIHLLKPRITSESNQIKSSDRHQSDSCIQEESLILLLSGECLIDQPRFKIIPMTHHCLQSSPRRHKAYLRLPLSH